MAATPQPDWTFGQWRDWANSRSPGSGDQFIAWVQANNNIPPPYALHMDSRTFGPSGFGSNNTATDWFGAWLLLGQLGPGIAKALASGITAGSKLIPKALTGAGQGIGKTPGATTLSGLDSIGNFFSQLGQANTWIRVGEVLLGVILIGIGIARITGAQNAVSSIVKARIP